MMVMETNALVEISRVEQALLRATTPAQSKAVESMAAAAKAWAKEQGDFENVVEAARIYILARRKTTELIEPTIGGFQGNQYVVGNDDVTHLEDYGFTKMQWQRRRKEVENITLDDIDAYFDDCIEKHTEPTSFGLIRYMSDPNIHISDDSYEWYTPIEYIEAAREVMGSIHLDPTSCKEANMIIKADNYFTKEQDGLSQEWSGTVWLNPPYNMPLIEQFVDKVLSEDVDQAIILTNNSTDTGWFHKLIGRCGAVCFTRGRIKFWGADGVTLATRQGQVLFYIGYNTRGFIDTFSKFGAVMVRA